MLEIIDIGIENATAFRMSGKITENDISLVLSDAKENVNQLVSFPISAKDYPSKKDQNHINQLHNVFNWK